jgi:hypothetical protein
MADLEAERRQARFAGATAVLAAVLLFTSIVMRLSSVQPDPDGGAAGAAQQFRDFDADRTTAATAVGLKVVALLLIVVVGNFLYLAVKARAPTAPRYLLILGIVMPIALAVTTVTGHFALRHVISTFLDLPATAQSNAAADQVSNDDTFTRVQRIVEIVCVIGFGVWLALLCVAAMGVGLLPKFLAYFGIGAAVAFVLANFAGEALVIGCLGSVGLMALDAWPGGRPRAWDSGQAEQPA